METLLARNKYLILLGSVYCFINSCSNTATPASNELSFAKDSVQLMVESIAKDISEEGPAGWLRYFENSPDFFMVSDGQMVFPNIDTAASFINHNLIRMITKIQLRWSNIRIDPLTSSLASISAGYHEDITDASGTITPHDGYFTGIAHKTSHGWKLHNAHWSGFVAH